MKTYLIRLIAYFCDKSSFMHNFAMDVLDHTIHGFHYRPNKKKTNVWTQDEIEIIFRKQLTPVEIDEMLTR